MLTIVRHRFITVTVIFQTNLIVSKNNVYIRFARVVSRETTYVSG